MRNKNSKLPGYRDGAAKIKGVAVMAALLAALFLVAAPMQPSYAEDENITVSCFKGNLDEGNNIGELTVNNVEDGGKDCNNSYEDCQGQCLGCIFDYNLSRQVCYDGNGEKILK
jgi:hypothetical protein